LVAAGHARPEAPTDFVVDQGVAMGRPSELLGTVYASAGVATLVRVAGKVIPIARGEIRVPDPAS
jgi:trans-2,3-dihydro-3-hydroxyanthranilate isomerase